MKNVIVSTFAASLTLGQMAWGEDCLNISQIAGPGKFPGGEYQLSDGTVLSLKLTEFWSMATPPAVIPGMAEVVARECFGEPNSLQLGNMSLVVQLVQNPTQTSRININFCDFGGHENVSARDAAPADFIDDVRGIDGKRLPDQNRDGVEMSIRQGGDILNSGGVRIGYDAKLVFQGPNPLETVIFGGQELFIANICVNG